MRENTHSWNVSKDEATAIQLRLARLVVAADQRHDYRYFAGVSSRQVDENRVRAAVSVVDVTTLKPVDVAIAMAQSHFPYVSGYRAFQDGPAIMSALENLHSRPDIVLWDGHGIAHPRHCGLASHLGVLLDLPSVGVSEQLFYGRCDVSALANERGSIVDIVDPDDGAVIGVALRTRKGIQPVFLSVGYNVSLNSAIGLVLKCSPRFRIPEPLRSARMQCKTPDR